MAAIKAVNTMIDVQQPNLDLNRPGFPDISKELGLTAKVIKESFAPAGASAGDVLAMANEQVDASLAKYKAGGMTPAEFEDEIRSNNIKLLSSSKLDPKDWGKVTAAMNGRADNLTQQYHFQADKKHYVMDAFNNLSTVYDPKRDKDQQDYDAIEAEFGKAVVAQIADMPDDAARKTRMDTLISIAAENSMFSYGVQRKKLDREATEIDVTTTKEQAAKQVNSYMSKTLPDLFEAYIGGAEADPDLAYANFKKTALRMWGSSAVKELAVESGLDYNTYNNNFVTQIGAFKDVFTAMSSQRKGSLEYETAKTEADLRLYGMINQFNDADFLTVMKPQAMNAMTMSRLMYGQLSNDVRNVLGIENVSQVYNKSLEKYLSKGKYDMVLDTAENWLDELGTGGETFNPYSLQQYYNAMVEIPELLSPEQKETFDRLKIKWDRAMTVNENFRASMTIGKKQLKK